MRYRNQNNFSTLIKTFVLAWLVCLLIPASVSCGKRNTYKWVYYDESYCADGWKVSSNNETLKQNIIEYYKNEDVVIYDIEIFSDRDAEQNNSCSNKTGRRVKCKIKYGDLKKMKSKGFYE